MKLFSLNATIEMVRDYIREDKGNCIDYDGINDPEINNQGNVSRDNLITSQMLHNWKAENEKISRLDKDDGVVSKYIMITLISY